MFVIGAELLKAMSSVMSPDEITIYITAHAIKKESGKLPSIVKLKEFYGPKAGSIIGRMKKRGIMPKGTLDFTKVNKNIRKSLNGEKVFDADKYAQEQANLQAKQLTMKLMRHLKALMNGTFKQCVGGDWFPKQIAVAKKALYKDKMEFKDLKLCIDWIFAEKFLSKHCTEMYKVLNYYPRYVIARESSGDDRFINNTNQQQDEWKAAVNG